MRAVLTRDEMRAADAAALAHVSHETLVMRAGTAVAVAALRMLGGAYGRRVVVVAGKGSNGADGRVAVHVLARRRRTLPRCPRPLPRGCRWPAPAYPQAVPARRKCP